MARVRYVSMYALSWAAGMLLAGAMLALGARFHDPVAGIVRETARQHAAAAEVKEGPYLAPLTVVLALLAAALTGAVLVRWFGS